MTPTKKSITNNCNCVNIQGKQLQQGRKNEQQQPGNAPLLFDPCDLLFGEDLFDHPPAAANLPRLLSSAADSDLTYRSRFLLDHPSDSSPSSYSPNPSETTERGDNKTGSVSLPGIMDLWSINVKNTGVPFLPRNPVPEKAISKLNSRSFIGGGTLEIKVLKTKRQSFRVTAAGKKNNGSDGNGNQSTPEGDAQKGSNASESSKSQKFSHKPRDWREFRAGLYIDEQLTKTASPENHKQERSFLGPRPLPEKWAHPISTPENGCLLVATEKLDGVRTFERTVVLLLRSGNRHPQEGPFGIVINRLLDKKIKHMKPTNLDLQTTFADCSLHFGGPLDASMFLLRNGENSNSQFHGFEEVIPGVCFGARNSLERASAMVKKGALKPHDFRFFLGYAGWQLDQLKEEIDSDYWYVAACSSNLIFQSSSSEGLWEEVLQLMGGHYSELSRKPKQDI